MKRTPIRTLATIMTGLSMCVQTAWASKAPDISQFSKDSKLRAGESLTSPYNIDGTPEMQNAVTLFMYPAHFRLSWETPSALFWDFLDIGARKGINGYLNGSDVYYLSDTEDITSINSYYVSTMGHTITHVTCTTSDNRKVDRWTSFTGENYPSVDNDVAFKEKLGLGVLFYQFNDGSIISGVENQIRLALNKGLEAGEPGHLPRFMEFGINTEQCDALDNMLVFYDGTTTQDGSTIEKPAKFYYSPSTTIETLNSNQDQNNSSVLYFDTEDPYLSYARQNGIFKLRSENISAPAPESDAQVGGGCAPYGAAVLKQAGLYDPTIFDQAWKRPVDVSPSLIGGPDHPVSLFKILAAGLSENGQPWHAPGETDLRHLDMYDPQLIWDFVGEVHCLLSSEEAEYGPGNIAPDVTVESKWLNDKSDQILGNVTAGVKYTKRSKDYTCTTIPGGTDEEIARRKAIGDLAKKWVQKMRDDNHRAGAKAVVKGQKAMSFTAVFNDQSTEKHQVTFDGIRVTMDFANAVRNKTAIDNDVIPRFKEIPYGIRRPPTTAPAVAAATTDADQSKTGGNVIPFDPNLCGEAGLKLMVGYERQLLEKMQTVRKNASRIKAQHGDEGAGPDETIAALQNRLDGLVNEYFHNDKCAVKIGDPKLVAEFLQLNPKINPNRMSDYLNALSLDQNQSQDKGKLLELLAK